MSHFFASAAADFDNHFLATSWFVDHILRILIDKYARVAVKMLPACVVGSD